MKNALILRNVSHIFDHKHILKNINLVIKPEEFITIIGPNGAGKTTLLKVILGIIKPSVGKILKQKTLKIGYVPQKINILPFLPLTVKNFLSLNHRNALDEIINITKINNLLDKYLYNLSGGELQRILLARALLLKPNMLLLDEPDQNLDISGQLEFYQNLSNIHKAQNITVIMVSHNLHMVMSRSEKVYCLYHHLCCSGSPQHISSDPAFLEIYGNDYKNLISIYEHHHNHKHC